MKIKNVFNVVLFSFIMIVTLVPIKIKIKMIPLSADFILGTVLLLIGFLCLIDMLIKRERILKPFNNGKLIFLSVMILIFTGLSIFSITYAGHKSAVISEVIRFLEYVFIFYMIIIISDEDTVERALKIFYFTMIFAALFGVVQFIFNWSKFTVGGFFGLGRIYSTFVNPNYWGAAVNLVIFYPIISLVEGKSKSRAFDIGVFLLFFFNLVFCSTRGSWLGFALGILVLCIVKYKKLIYYFFATIAAIFLIPLTRARFFQLLNVKERLLLWKTGFLMFKEHFWLGVGNGNYIYEYKAYVTAHRELYLGRNRFSVHNSYIKMFAELGIFGGISFILMYLGIFNLIIDVYRNSTKYRNYALAFITFGATYLFQNFFNNLVFIPQLNVFVWIIAALLYKGMYFERQGEYTWIR